MADGVGFEPTGRFDTPTAFPVPRLRPLGQPSVFHLKSAIAPLINFNVAFGVSLAT